MIKSIYGLSIALSLAVMSFVPLLWDVESPTNLTTNSNIEEGSHPTVSSTSSSTVLMDIVIDCIDPSTVDTIYLDKDGQIPLDVNDFFTGINRPPCDSFSITGSIDTLQCNDVVIPIMYMVIASDTCMSTPDTCMFPMTVLDTIPPTILCPSDTVITSSLTECNIPVSLSTIATDDNCTVDTLYNNIASIDLYDGTLPYGCTDLIYFAEDIFGNTSTCTYNVTVDFVPNSNQLPVVIVNTGDDSCSATITLAEPINNTCGLTITRTPATNEFSIDTTEVEWIIGYNCGDPDTLYQEVIVMDNENPALTCNGAMNVTLSTGDFDAMPKAVFVKNLTDNCQGHFIKYGVSRMTGLCPGQTNDIFGDEVGICCQDINASTLDDVMVIVTAEDRFGNRNQCMVSVNITDGSAPTIDEGLPPITVSCDYFLNIPDFSEFGTIRFDEIDRLPISIDDPLFNLVGAEDGLATDNCSKLTLTETYEDLRVNNAGNIVRKLKVCDEIGRCDSTFQTITIRDIDILTINDITFPNDTTIVDSCGANLEPNRTGEPIINNDDICTMATSSKDDLVFDDHSLGCKFIKRTWTVIDMAQFQPNTNLGRWSKVQYITLDNNYAPTITSSSEDRSFCAPLAQCDGNIQMHVIATDDCTSPDKMYYRYLVDIDKDGSIDHEGTNDSLDVFVPAGNHLVTWKVEDRCGNITKQEINIEMKECKSPTPICLNGLSIDLTDKLEAETWASDFNNHSSDNCTATKDLIFSFSSDTKDRKKVFTCDQLGRNPISMWVTDETGNQSQCLTFINVSDNRKMCLDTDTIPYGDYNVAGLIATEENTTIPQTKMNISDNLDTKVAITDNEGKFMFEALPGGVDYMLKAQKGDQCLEGVSTLDLVLIQRHILGISKLKSPYKIIAADVNNSKKISTADLVELRKLILGTKSEFTNTDCWKFIDKSFTFDDPAYPWNYPTGHEIETIDIDLMSNDFVAIKMGDVNGSVSNIHQSSTENRSSKESKLITKDVVFDDGEEVIIPVKLDAATNLLAMQINFTYDLTALDFEEIISPKLELDDAQSSHKTAQSLGNITVAYSDVQSTSLKKGDDILLLKFTAKRSDRLSSVFTENSSKLKGVIYDDNESMHYIDFRFDQDELNALEVSVPSPNPFVDHTNITIALAEQMSMHISIYNQAGVKVFTNYTTYRAGISNISITDKMLQGQSGIFYVHLAGAETKQIKKIIRIK